MNIPKRDCLFFTKYGKCTHLDRGRGFLWLGKPCILDYNFVGSCTKQHRHPRPTKNPLGSNPAKMK
jgi:hypothetical protein